MSRINTVTLETATEEQKALLNAIQGQLGIVPNFLKVFANSPSALRAFLGLHSIANEGSARFGILLIVQHTVIDLGHWNVENLWLLRSNHWGWHWHSAGLVLIVAAA